MPGVVHAEAPPIPPVQQLFIPGNVRLKSDVCEYEAHLIARSICAAVQIGLSKERFTNTEEVRSVNYGDFLIITRTTKQLHLYGRALEQYGIPHRVIGGKTLSNMRELDLLRTCMAAVTEPENPVALVAALRDEHSDVRGGAAQVLGQIGDPLTVEPLVAALLDEHGHARWAAARALGQIGDPLAVEPLIVNQ